MIVDIAPGLVNLGSRYETQVDQQLRFLDNQELRFGAGGDSGIYYDGTDTIWDLAAVGSGQLLITEGAVIVPEGVVHIFSGAAAQGATPNSNADDLVIESSGNAGISFLTGSANLASFYFRDNTGNSGVFAYSHSSGRFEFTVENTAQLHWSDGAFNFQAATDMDMLAGSIQLTERTAPGAGAANTVRIYAVVDGGSLTDLAAVFQDGTVDLFAQEV